VAKSLSVHTNTGQGNTHGISVKDGSSKTVVNFRTLLNERKDCIRMAKSCCWMWVNCIQRK